MTSLKPTNDNLERLSTPNSPTNPLLVLPIALMSLTKKFQFVPYLPLKSPRGIEIRT